MRTDPEKAVFIAVKKFEQLVSIHKTLPRIKKRPALASLHTQVHIFVVVCCFVGF